MMKPSPPAWEHQTRAGIFLEDKPGAMLAMEMGTGKDLDDRTPIATTQGWTPMGELQVGQQVFDERGRPCTVTGVYPQGERPVYDVALDDGAVIRAGYGHLWVTMTSGDRDRIHKGRNAPENWTSCLTPITTEEIRQSLVHQRGTPVESMHSIPVAQPLELPDAELPIDPYTLGLWLGGGTAAEAAVTCHEDGEPRHAAAAAGENRRPGNRSGNNLTCTMAGGEMPVMRNRLVSLGVFTNKQIPARYLRAGAGQRTRLLQGLIDSDGQVDPGSGNVEFTSTSEKLAGGALELALSLGQKATMQRGDAVLNGKRISGKWRVIFAPAMEAASLPRKREKPHPSMETGLETALSRTNQRYIRSVEPAGTVPTTCITVDSPSRLFLAGREMIPTHNSKVAIDHMESIRANLTLVLAPLSVVDHVWPREIQRHGTRGNVTVIPLGTKAGTVRQKMTRAAEGLKLATARKGPAVIIVNYESAYRTPLSSFLKGINWDLLVMDESHKIKKAAGQISRFVSQLADKSRRRLALTGTPMPHDPLDIYAQYRAIDKRVFGVSNTEFKNQYAEFDIVSGPIITEDENGEKVVTYPKKVTSYKNLEELNRKFYSLAFRVTAAETLDLPGAIETYMHVELGREARKLYNQMAESFIAEMDSGDVITAANALARLVRFQQLTSGFARTADDKTIEIDRAKMQALSDILDGLPPGEPVVVFARFQNDLDVIERLADRMERPHFEISGRVKDLDEWNRRGGVLAVQIQAGGLGLDLTAARYCVYYSLGFNLGDYLQSIARLHRPGQTSLVDYIHLVAADSIDEIVVEALANKEDVINRILETKDLTNGSLTRTR